MKHSDKQKFVGLMLEIAKIYERNIDKSILEIWWQALRDFTIDEVSTALSAHIQNPDNGQYMPKPADVIRHLRGNTRLQACQAWTKTLEAIKRYGCYHNVVFDDALIHAVVHDMGGWIQLSKMSYKDEPYREIKFIELYTMYCVTPPNYLPKQLSGLYPTNPLKKSEPIFIGDKTLAQKVFDGTINLIQQEKIIQLHHHQQKAQQC